MIRATRGVRVGVGVKAGVSSGGRVEVGVKIGGRTTFMGVAVGAGGGRGD